MSSQIPRPPRTALLLSGLAACALALLTAGCSLPRCETSLHDVLKHELDRDAADTPPYRCTMGAHRGASVEHRENTLKALKAAQDDRRFAFIEFDVQYSKDNRIVVFHDTRLLRLFGSLRAVGGTTFADLSELTGGEVCAYDDAMKVLKKKLNIEIKSQGDDEEDARLADELIADLRARRRDKDVLISSISGEVIKYIKAKYPEFPTGKIYWLTRSTYLHFDSLTEGLYEDFHETQADYLMLHVANLRNLEDLLRFKPDGKTIVFWDFDDRMYVIHKDLSDRLWGDSALKNWCRHMRYQLVSPAVSRPAPEHPTRVPH